VSATHHLKMAKASQSDIDAAIELYQFLQATSNGRGADEVIDEFGYKGYDDLLEREATDVEFVLRAHERGGLFRVVWGMQVLLDPANEVVDPNLPHLELHPKHVQAARELESLCKAKNEAIDERDELRRQLDQIIAVAVKVTNTAPLSCGSNQRELDHYDACGDLAVAIARIVEQPKPVAWPHLPEVDRPDSEVQP
jgi:hypothetical protein